ncbi:MAG: riboflavin synthase [Burkholderiales bacterium]|nr:riboflavin synthase [Burkholderiales bacterium]
MFTGIVATTGTIERISATDRGMRMVVRAPDLDLSDVESGDSICVDGVCLTAIGFEEEEAFVVDVSQETIDRTAGFRLGAQVNLEKALRLSDRLGGHLVSGHVDGCGEVLRFEPVGESWLLELRCEAGLEKYIARKGSVTVNGVSLTVNRVQEGDFSINLIPHTLQVTNLHALAVGVRVNLEVDLLARYLERLLEAGGGR